MTQARFDLIVGAVEIVCLIVCLLKWKFWTVILTIVGMVVMTVGPLITGNYIANVLSPFVTLAPVFGAIRLARPVSWWAEWFYWGPMDSDRRLVRPNRKFARALARFPEQTGGFGDPSAENTTTAGDERKLTIEQQAFIQLMRRQAAKNLCWGLAISVVLLAPTYAFVGGWLKWMLAAVILFWFTGVIRTAMGDLIRAERLATGQSSDYTSERLWPKAP